MSLALSHFNSDAAEIVNKYFEGTDPIFSNVLSFNSIRWEAAQLNESESILSTKEFMRSHLDLILNGGTSAVTEYHRNLALGKNKILEKAKNFSNSVKVDESLRHFKKTLSDKLSQLINENELAQTGGVAQTSQFSDMQNRLSAAFDALRSNKAKDAQMKSLTMASPNSANAEVDAAIAGKIQENPEQSGTWGLLKKLWNAVTEGGSGIGILHLVLDIIGVIGDFIVPGVGAIADIINAIIYFFREKWMLGTISLIAGLVIGGGDALKLLKGSATAAEKVMVKSATKGTAEGAAELSKIPAKEQGGVIKLLRYIAKNIGGVLGTAISMLSKFFDGFISKIVGWIPLIGRPLKTFFEKVGQFFAKYADNMTNFSKGFTKVETEALAIASKEADQIMETFFKSEGEMVIDASTGMVKCTDKSGKVIGEFSSEVFTNPKVLNGKYPNLFKAGEKEMIAKYFTSVAKSNAKITANTVEKMVALKLASANAARRLLYFIGKQVIKVITGDDEQKGNYKKEEVEYWGNSAFQTWVNDRLAKERKERGATYLPNLDLNSSEQEVFDRITNYQNNYAKIFGQPYIIPVIYDKYGNDEVEEEFKDFWKEAGKSREAEFKKLEQEESLKNKKEANESASLKYIIPFSRFIA